MIITLNNRVFNLDSTDLKIHRDERNKIEVVNLKLSLWQKIRRWWKYHL